MSTPKVIDPVLQQHTRLVRILEANLKIKSDDPLEARFRASLITMIETEAPNMNATLVTRLYEAVAAMEFPPPNVIELRKKLQAVIGRNLNLKQHSAR